MIVVGSRSAQHLHTGAGVVARFSRKIVYRDLHFPDRFRIRLQVGSAMPHHRGHRARIHRVPVLLAAHTGSIDIDLLLRGEYIGGHQRSGDPRRQYRQSHEVPPRNG